MAVAAAAPTNMTVEQTTKIKDLCTKLNITTAHAKQEIAGVPKGTLLTFDGAAKLIETLERNENSPIHIDEEMI